MPTFADTMQEPGGAVADYQAVSVGRLDAPVRREQQGEEREHLLSAILTTSLCLHLLLIGYLGFGLPAEAPYIHAALVAPPPPAIVENVQLEAPPPPKPGKEALPEPPPPAAQDLPAPIAAIAAVPANVAVACAIKAMGPVRLVADAAEASSGSLAAPLPPSVPREVVGRNLLTPELVYPAEALYRRYTGRVVVEFRTTARGDIVDARIRSSSGYDVLDRAALENLRLGRWVGESGYFAKTYEFILR